MYIDTHTHCRDGNQSYKETIAHALGVAEKAGVDAIFAMPNTNPPITSRRLVEESLAIADKCNSSVFYGLYVGLTSDPEQVAEAVKIHRDLFPRVVGLKLFAGESVGDLKVIEEEKQKQIYSVLGKTNYEGVLVVHCEKQSELKPELWNSRDPITHSFARPAKAELESIKDQVKFAWENEFKGNLHIAHISTPESVEYVGSIRRNLGNNDISRLRISCGATPHHLFLNYEIMNNKTGLLWKVNPALRSRMEQKGLLKCLRDEKIDWIETDHAPHALREKLNEPYMSGIPGLDSWPKVYKRLLREEFSKEKINDLVFNNAHKIFQIPDGVIVRTENIGDLNLNKYDYGYGDVLLK